MSKILTSRTIKEQRVPGEEGVFIFVIIDMLVFAALFSSYVYERLKDTELYVQSQTYLSVNTGTFNTLVLLSSSWFLIVAIRALENQRRRLCLLFLALTMMCGMIFGISKGLEYKAKIAADISMFTNDFFMFYFIMTGLHFVHVAIGGIVLLVMFIKIRNKRAGVYGLESAATYWHMVDLLWIMIFPLLYIMR